MSQDSSAGTEQPDAEPAEPAAETEPAGPSEPAAETQPAAETEPAGPSEPAAETEPPPPPAAAPKPRRTWLMITLVTVVAVVVAGLGAGYLLLDNLREGVPEVGECLTEAPEANDMSVVGCDSDQAAWSVIGAGGTMTQQEFRELTAQDPVCQEHAGTEQALWVTDAWFVGDSSDGTVVCLQRIGAGAPEPADPSTPEPAESGSA